MAGLFLILHLMAAPVALKITRGVGTMWCAYIFTAIAVITLPHAIRGGTSTLIPWIAQTFLQLVLLSVIMVGQNVQAIAADKRSEATYEDADTVVVNTCGFLDSARDESLDAIGEALARNGKVVVTGCLGAEADLIRERFPEVAAITGAHRYDEVDRKSTRLNSSHIPLSRMPSSA